MSDQTADITATEDKAPGPYDGLISAAPALLLGLAALGFLFRSEAMMAWQVWEASTAYSHCYFVLPIAGYLIWDRRRLLIGLHPEPLPAVALLIIPLAIAWLGAERLGIAEGRQLVAMTMLQCLFLGVLGWRMYWGMSAGLLYLYFAVPFGAFLTAPLQHFTARFSKIGLDLLGIPNYVDDLLIDIPAGSFYVAEACAGLRFLIASIAFGVLYSCLIYRSPWRRAGFMLASIVIPIIANAFRALGIVLLGHVLGSAEAAAADHILYGWMFFSIVIVLLIVAGMPFREDSEDHAIPTPNAPAEGDGRFAMRPMLAAGLVGVFAAIGPAIAVVIDRNVAPPAPVSLPRFTAPAGCTLAPNQEPGRQLFTCGPLELGARIEIFAPRANPNRLIVARRQATGEDTAAETENSTLDMPGAFPERWRLTVTTEPGWMTATTLWLDGEPRGGGVMDRYRQARATLEGSTTAPILVSIGVRSPKERMGPADREMVQKLIRSFITAQRNLGDQIIRLSAEAARGP